ncbi:hypothetical protein scyTo_0012572 [Scyliorhinus torazame]|uniref:RNase H type-1 domain-containing protein n=1 Tax=Scyliorhinus torazame TaxID=75743 RepID=A0A401PAR9_SCYTO|nr:hypothetical protein [Scyliorhinus torazame]
MNLEEDRIKDTPLATAEETFYVDGSHKYVDGRPRTGNGALETVESGRIDGGLSVQMAELVALTKAPELSENKTVNIYTDSSIVKLCCAKLMGQVQPVAPMQNKDVYDELLPQRPLRRACPPYKRP